MQKIELGEVQERFANMIWELEPIKSMELVKVTEHLTNKVVVGIPSAISNMLSESQPDRYRMK